MRSRPLPVLASLSLALLLSACGGGGDNASASGERAFAAAASRPAQKLPAWTSGVVSTLDRTLRRKTGITRGSVPPGAPAVWDVALEWDVLPQNTVSGLGAR